MVLLLDGLLVGVVESVASCCLLKTNPVGKIVGVVSLVVTESASVVLLPVGAAVRPTDGCCVFDVAIMGASVVMFRVGAAVRLTSGIRVCAVGIINIDGCADGICGTIVGAVVGAPVRTIVALPSLGAPDGMFVGALKGTTLIFGTALCAIDGYLLRSLLSCKQNRCVPSKYMALEPGPK